MSNLNEIPKYNKLSEPTRKFIEQLNNYLPNDELRVYGSILRRDYVDGKSDIDMSVFTDNEQSAISKIAHFLHTKKENFKKIIWKLNGHMIYGYKIKCDEITNINCEIAIYNNTFREILITEQKRPQEWTFLVYFLLYILKLFHYILPILSKQNYAYLKRTIMHNKLGSEFLLI